MRGIKVFVTWLMVLSCGSVLFGCAVIKPETSRPQLIGETVYEQFAFFSDTLGARTHYREAEWPEREEFSLEFNAGASLDESLHPLIKQTASLRDGHTSLPYSIVGEYPGIRLRYFAGEGIAVEEVSSCCSLQPGDRILAVCKADSPDAAVPEENWEELFREAKQLIPASSEEAGRQYAANSIIAVAVMDGEYSHIGFRIERQGEVLTEFVEKRSHDHAFEQPDEVYRKEITDGPNLISYICIPTMRYLDDIDRIDRKINASLDSDGIILDLRGNTGGSSAVSEYLISRFALTEEFSFLIVSGSTGEVDRTIGPPPPRGKQYAGPTAVLVDHHVFSAAHHFASLCRYVNDRGFRDTPFLLIGGKTGGGSGVAERFVFGEIVMYITTSIMMNPQFEHYERGIYPDVDVLAELCIEDLRSSPVLHPVPSEQFHSAWRNDPVIQAALEHLEE